MNSLRAIFVSAILLVVRETSARGAGRAFPVHAENYVIENFQRINPDIEWDPTNFLVDQSGYYANCNNQKRTFESIAEVTPEGNTIGALYDYVEGNGVDAEKVNMYIRAIIDRWMRSNTADTPVLGADRFGCSVRPGCSGFAVVACLFSPGSGRRSRPNNHPGDEPNVPQEGQAFTKEQYSLAEEITGNNWDREHFLENLSGFEITCRMLDSNDWSFENAQAIGRQYGKEVFGLFGVAPNRGSTQNGMEKILHRFKQMQKPVRSTAVGCSVIPDCTAGRGDLADEMYVVVACIYEEGY